MTNINKVSLVIVFTTIIVFIHALLVSDSGPSRPLPATLPGSSRLSEMLGDAGSSAFPRATQPRAFVFPGDHGPHPAYRNEWWYVTGNLDASPGERFGFELTIFRFSLTPAAPVTSASRWRTNQVFIGHLAVTDVEREQFHVSQRFSRGSLGLAGASAEPFAVWVEDWSIRAAAVDTWRLRAADRRVEIDVSLVPLKKPVLNGIDGLSRKSAEPGNASYYYSIPRLRTEGSLRIDGEEYAVSGLSWLDREWGSSALSAEQRGWDWFSLQLADGSDLMFYAIRRDDGGRDAASAGTFIAADGSGTYLASDDVAIEVLDHWDSPAGGRYPIAWKMRVPRYDLELTIEPVIREQELMTIVRYWEGAVDVRGSRAGSAVNGRGYVELTGYADSESR